MSLEIKAGFFDVAGEHYFYGQKPEATSTGLGFAKINNADLSCTFVFGENVGGEWSLAHSYDVQPTVPPTVKFHDSLLVLPMGSQFTYVGEWRNGEKHGLGLEATTQNVTWGTFENGLLNGYAVRHSQNFRYEGNFEAGVESGYGVLKSKAEPFFTYSGAFLNGKPHGLGVRVEEEANEEVSLFGEDEDTPVKMTVKRIVVYDNGTETEVSFLSEASAEALKAVEAAKSSAAKAFNEVVPKCDELRKRAEKNLLQLTRILCASIQLKLVSGPPQDSVSLWSELLGDLFRPPQGLMLQAGRHLLENLLIQHGKHTKEGVDTDHTENSILAADDSLIFDSEEEEDDDDEAEGDEEGDEEEAHSQGNTRRESTRRTRRSVVMEDGEEEGAEEGEEEEGDEDFDPNEEKQREKQREEEEDDEDGVSYSVKVDTKVPLSFLQISVQQCFSNMAPLVSDLKSTALVEALQFVYTIGDIFPPDSPESSLVALVNKAQQEIAELAQSRHVKLGSLHLNSPVASSQFDVAAVEALAEKLAVLVNVRKDNLLLNDYRRKVLNPLLHRSRALQHDQEPSRLRGAITKEKKATLNTLQHDLQNLLHEITHKRDSRTGTVHFEKVWSTWSAHIKQAPVLQNRVDRVREYKQALRKIKLSALLWSHLHGFASKLGAMFELAPEKSITVSEAVLHQYLDCLFCLARSRIKDMEVLGNLYRSQKDVIEGPGGGQGILPASLAETKLLYRESVARVRKVLFTWASVPSGSTPTSEEAVDWISHLSQTTTDFERILATYEEDMRETSKTLVLFRAVFEQHAKSGLPENPRRMKAVLTGLEKADLSPVQSTLVISDDMLLTAHDADYLRHLEDKCGQLEDQGCSTGLSDIEEGTPDTTINSLSLKIAKEAAATVCEAVDHVCRVSGSNAFCCLRPPGHHAGTAGPAMGAGRARLPQCEDDSCAGKAGYGFCLLNNVAVGAFYALKNYPSIHRVAIVDFDLHHGNGTEEIVEARGNGNVLLISLHVGPIYPQTGTKLKKYTASSDPPIVCVPLPPHTKGEAYINAFQRYGVSAINVFKPDLIMISAGFDGHAKDTMGSMGLSLFGPDYASITRHVVGLAMRHCEGRIVSVLEGGYGRETEKDQDWNMESLIDGVSHHTSALKEGAVDKNKIEFLTFAEAGFPLLDAVLNRDEHRVKEILRERTEDIKIQNDVKVKNWPLGTSVLHLCCATKPEQKLPEAITKELLANGADINLCDEYGWSPAHWAASRLFPANEVFLDLVLDYFDPQASLPLPLSSTSFSFLSPSSSSSSFPSSPSSSSLSSLSSSSPSSSSPATPSKPAFTSSSSSSSDSLPLPSFSSPSSSSSSSLDSIPSSSSSSFRASSLAFLASPSSAFSKAPKINLELRTQTQPPAMEWTGSVQEFLTWAKYQRGRRHSTAVAPTPSVKVETTSTVTPSRNELVSVNSEAALDSNSKAKDFLRRKNDLYLRKIAALEAQGKVISSSKRQAVFDEAELEIWVEMGGGSSRKRARH